MQVSPLSFLDLDSVVFIEKQCFSAPWSKENYSRALAHKNFYLLGCKEKGEIFAYISFYIVDNEMEIVNIATAELHRRKGLAKRLLTFALDFARANGCVHTLLEVRQSNIAAITLYEGLGFVKIGCRKKYYASTGEDALVYEKKY